MKQTGVPDDVMEILRSTNRHTDIANEKEPPKPEFHGRTGRLLSVVPTIGNTLLHTERFAKNEGEKLHVFRDGVYRDDGREVIRTAGQRLMEEWGAASQWKKGIADEVYEWILLKSPALWSRPPLNRICLQNGILNLQTGQLDPHSPDWLSSIQLPVTYDPCANCPELDAFAAAALPGDVYQAEVIYQLLALLMIPYTSAQRAVLLQGPRGTGKSRFLAMIRAFLGPENTSSQSLHTLEENRFACPYLYGRLANICADLPSRDLESTSKFKAITGEDFIDAEYKHGAQFQFKPFARLLFSANKPPQSNDVSDAFLDRWWVIPFTERFQDTDKQIAAADLDARLSHPRELSGALNRALKWLPRVLEQKGLTQTPVMREAHDEFCAVTDPFRVWLAEFISDDPDGVEPCNEVMASYFSWRRQRGLPGVTKTAFGLELRKNRKGIDMKERTVKRDGRLATPLCYIGIRLQRKGEVHD